MSRRQALNPRRLTKKQVEALISGGATPRPDLEQALENVSTRLGIRVYELPESRVLWVFGDTVSGIAGKGDIYTLDYCHRFIRWADRVNMDSAAGRASSVSHWFHFSRVRTDLPDRVSRLVEELGHLVMGTHASLELTYAGLDAASDYVASIGVQRAQLEIYDHLVAYVGEVIRLRTRGEWKVETRSPESYPCVVAAKHAVIMPINVVWSELSGLDSADFRKEAANEVRRARARYL